MALQPEVPSWVPRRPARPFTLIPVEGNPGPEDRPGVGDPPDDCWHFLVWGEGQVTEVLCIYLGAREAGGLTNVTIIKDWVTCPECLEILHS